MIDLLSIVPHNVLSETLIWISRVTRYKPLKYHQCSKCGLDNDRKPHRYCKKCHATYMREWRKTHPLSELERFKAAVRSKTKMRIRRGLLVKYPCEQCGHNKSEAHHDDYLQPYCIRWLCLPCHRKYHAEQYDKRRQA